MTVLRALRGLTLGLPVGTPLDNVMPIFIVGSGRSGTTLMRAVLEAHPQLHIPPETYVLGAVIKDFRAYRRLPWSAVLRLLLARFEFLKKEHDFGISLRDLYNELLEIPDKERSLRRILNGIYMAHAAEHKPTATRWGDKTPANTQHLSRIRAVYTRGRFVHMIRDGRDVVSSYLEMGRYRTLDEAAARWRESVSLARDFGRKYPDSYLEVRYENLVSQPSSVLEQLCRFTDLPLHSNMLEHHMHQTGLADVGLQPHLANVQKPLTTASVGKWRSRLSMTDQARLTNLLEPVLSETGYH